VITIGEENAYVYRTVKVKNKCLNVFSTHSQHERINPSGKLGYTPPVKIGHCVFGVVMHAQCCYVITDQHFSSHMKIMFVVLVS